MNKLELKLVKPAIRDVGKHLTIAGKAKTRKTGFKIYQ